VIASASVEAKKIKNNQQTDIEVQWEVTWLKKTPWAKA
jgi:hypothetical protein